LVAETLNEFVEVGVTEFCPSGYPNLPEVERFGRLVPYFRTRWCAWGLERETSPLNHAR
jgi:hypothetical protein